MMTDLFYSEFLLLKEAGANCVIFMKSGAIFYCNEVAKVNDEHVFVITHYINNSEDKDRIQQVIKFDLIDRIAYPVDQSGNAIKSTYLTEHLVKE